MSYTPPAVETSKTTLGLSGSVQTEQYAPPPKRQTLSVDDGTSDHKIYTRDPRKLTAYLVPLPTPAIQIPDNVEIPKRFLIYTPPAPPLAAPKEGTEEARIHKLQRKWQTEVREAKTSDAKLASWKGMKSAATKGISAAMNKTTSSSLDFLNRVPDAKASGNASNQPGRPVDGQQVAGAAEPAGGLEEMILIYPSSLPGTELEIREQFINTMLRSKSKAQKDAIIATGLLPVSLAVDILLTVVWPFGGLVEIDGVWAYSSFRGAKTARSVTKRLNSSESSDAHAEEDQQKLRLTFTPSPRLEILRLYLLEECHRQNSKLFQSEGAPPTATDVLNAIGWTPSQTGGETKNWEDEQWELREVKEDLQQTMHKGAKEWEKWSKAFEKDPEKALKK